MEDGRDRLGQERVGELPAREVDRDAGGRPRSVGVLPPAGDLAAALGEDERAERHDEPGLLGVLHELAGQEQPTLRVLPAHERLEADHEPAAQADHGLVVDADFPLPERTVQLARRGQVFVGSGLHRLVEDLVARLSPLLRVVHCGVRMPQEPLRIVARAAGESDPDADGEEDLAAVDRQRLLDRAGDALGHRHRLTLLDDAQADEGDSSPPKRATVSAGRIAAASRWATATSTLSPNSCPRLSFTTLKRSRSRKRTATEGASERAPSSAVARRSRKRARFGRPVSGSCRAR